MKNTIVKLVTGSVGIASTEAVPSVISTIAENPSDIVSVVVQIIIGIATLFGLFKKKKVVKIEKD